MSLFLLLNLFSTSYSVIIYLFLLGQGSWQFIPPLKVSHLILNTRVIIATSLLYLDPHLASCAFTSHNQHLWLFLADFPWVLAAAAKSLQSCPTLGDPINGSPPGSPVPGILQAKTLELGCHFLLQCMKVKSESEVAQSCPTLSDPMDCSLPGSSIHGIVQARVLEWGAVAFSALGS